MVSIVRGLLAIMGHCKAIVTLGCACSVCFLDVHDPVAELVKSFGIASLA